MSEAEITDTSDVVMMLGSSGPRSGSRTGVPANAESVRSLLDALTDEHSRRIVSSAVARGRTIEEISSEQGIPLSTCYRKVGQLVVNGVMMVERRVVTASGRRYTLYRSAFRYVSVEMEDGEVSFHVKVNPEVAEKLKHQGLAKRWKEG